MTIGERLKSLRLNAKKTLQEQSEIFNVALNTVYRWEHNLVMPRKPVLKAIAAYYGVPLDWLTSGEIDKEPINCKNCINCVNCLLNPENNIERKILNILKKLPDNKKYKILGYIERMCIEENTEK